MRLCVTNDAIGLKLLYNAGEIWTFEHRRRSSVNFGGQDIFARKYMHEKLTKFPNFTWYRPGKINKMPKFYMIFARKIFFPNFFAPPCPPVSYAYDFEHRCDTNCDINCKDLGCLKCELNSIFCANKWCDKLNWWSIAATHNAFVANFAQIVIVQEFWKSVNI